MALKFEKSTEAFLAVLTVVIGADQLGSLAERDFLLDRLKGVELFAGMPRAELVKLLGQVTETVYDTLPKDDMGLSTAGVSELLAAARAALSPALQKSLVEVATALSASDQTSAEETALLAQIRLAFGA
jgi:hypothetical protein